MSSQPVVSALEEGSIADTAERALQLLLCCRDITSEEPQKLALTQLARFNLWASNIGVFASRHASLDYRLRTALSVRAAIEGNLEIVCKHLLTSKLPQSLTGKIINWYFHLVLKASSESSEEEFDTLFDSPRSQVISFAKKLLLQSMPNDHMRIKAFELVESRITVLHRLSLAIRRASNRDNLTKIPKLLNFDTDYVIIREYKGDGVSPENFIPSVCFDIGADFREFVRKALTHRWFRYRTSDEEDLNKEQNSYRKALLDRCILAVSTRRRQLEYFSAHQNRLERNERKGVLFKPLGGKSAGHDELQPALQPSEKDPSPELPKDLDLNQPRKVSYEPSNYTHDDTVVSEFIMTNFKAPPLSSAPSSSASTTANGGFGGGGPFDVPPPPKLDGNEKEKACPYCYLVLPARTFSTQKRAKRWSGIFLKTCNHMSVYSQTASLPGRRTHLSRRGSHISTSLITTVGSAPCTQKMTTAMPKIKNPSHSTPLWSSRVISRFSIRIVT